jgi:hypothetical protein
MNWQVTRRGAISALGAAGAVPLLATGLFVADNAPALAIFDSRIAESRAFASRMKASGARLFDVASQDQSLWREARGGFGLAKRSRVAGLTRWSDWVAVSSLLAEQGHRAKSHEKVRTAAHQGLFSWSMA